MVGYNPKQVFYTQKLCNATLISVFHMWLLKTEYLLIYYYEDDKQTDKINGKCDGIGGVNSVIN